MNRLLIPLLIIVIMTIAGCTSMLQEGDQMLEDGTVVKPDGTMVKPDGTMIKPDGTMIEPDSQMEGKYSGTLLAGSSAPLLDFKKADYDAALQTDKLIVLYFYAEWCPICRAELPELYSAFDGLQASDVVGFRVNFNDAQTDSDEVDLARQFGVPYQHTKVFVKNGQSVLKSSETWNRNRYASEIAAH